MVALLFGFNITIHLGVKSNVKGEKSSFEFQLAPIIRFFAGAPENVRNKGRRFLIHEYDIGV